MSNKPLPIDTPDNNSTALSRRLPLFIIITILLVLIVYLKFPQESTSKGKAKRVVAVKIYPVIMTEFVETVEAVGTARANEQVVITSKYADFINKVYFDDGQVVKKSEALIQLHNQEEVAKVNELTANLSESKAQLKRLTDLLASKATSRSAVEQQTSATKAIEAQLVSARAKLEDLTIRAPFSGILGFREVSEGAYIDSGDVITSLDDLSHIKINFHLPERLLTQVQTGQQINAVTAAYRGQVFTGKITAIDSRIEPSTRSIKVRAIISNENLKLRPGMMLNITVLTQTENILQLPESSIIPIEDKHFVYIIKDDVAVRKAIKLGRRQPGIVEVVSGLVEGEQIVVEGALKLREGSAVNIISSTSSASPSLEKLATPHASTSTPKG